MRAVLYIKKALESLKFEYWLIDNNSCTFWHFRPILIILLTVQKTKNFNSRTISRQKAINSNPDGRSEANFYREMGILGYIKFLLMFWHFWTIRIPTRKSRSLIFLPKCPPQVKRCWLLFWWKNFSFVVVEKNEFQNLDEIIDNIFGGNFDNFSENKEVVPSPFIDNFA